MPDKRLACHTSKSASAYFIMLNIEYSCCDIAAAACKGHAPAIRHKLQLSVTRFIPAPHLLFAVQHDAHAEAEAQEGMVESLGVPAGV